MAMSSFSQVSLDMPSSALVSMTPRPLDATVLALLAPPLSTGVSILVGQRRLLAEPRRVVLDSMRCIPLRRLAVVRVRGLSGFPSAPPCYRGAFGPCLVSGRAVLLFLISPLLVGQVNGSPRGNESDQERRHEYRLLSAYNQLAKEEMSVVCIRHNGSKRV